MKSLTAVILAAGANTRVQQVVPAYMKPLILVNGQPLIKHATHHARYHWMATNIVVVCSPDNAKMLTQVDSADHWAVQPQPDGVMDALQRAMPLVFSDMVLILCADNTFEGPENLNAYNDKAQQVVGCRSLAACDGQRMSRLETSPDDARVVTRLTRVPTENNQFRYWVGPLLLNAKALRHVVDRYGVIDDAVTWCATQPDFGGLHAVDMQCEDVGIPEMLP